MYVFEIARQKYKPDKIKFLFVAEAPPKADSNRFFYFENIDKHDSLFLETLKVLYPELTTNVETKVIRKKKKVFLEMFKNDGFYLIDSLDIPFEKRYSRAQKIKLIRSGQLSLLKKIKILSNHETKVILIATPVYSANYSYLKQNGVNVINTESIDFPGSGGQTKYKSKLAKLLSKLGYQRLH